MSTDRLEATTGEHPPLNLWTGCFVASVVVLLSIFLIEGGRTIRAQASDEEYQVKAAFIFHFAQLVDWPPDMPKGAPLILCTLGEDPFNGALESTVAGKMVRNRTIHIRHLKGEEGMQGCQILFLGKAQSARIPELLADLGKAPVLTVGETPGFLGAGGMICFVLEAKDVRFGINLYAAQSAKLKIGSRLSFLAQTVIGENPGK